MLISSGDQVQTTRVFYRSLDELHWSSFHDVILRSHLFGYISVSSVGEQRIGGEWLYLGSLQGSIIAADGPMSRTGKRQVRSKLQQQKDSHSAGISSTLGDLVPTAVTSIRIIQPSSTLQPNMPNQDPVILYSFSPRWLVGFVFSMPSWVRRSPWISSFVVNSDL